jgi:tRNA (guanine-N7-)-methyltransferase
MKTFSNVLQPPFEEIFNKDFHLKGRWNCDFFTHNFPITLELGCGKGEYTVGMAKHYPERNFIGIDIKGARIWKGAKSARDENLDNAGFLRARIDFINSFFASDEIHEIWITFPDPQPKKFRKRLTSGFFLSKYTRLLCKEGYINLKTDNADLFNYTLKLAQYNNLKIDFSTSDLYASGYANDILSIKTYYEEIWLNNGLPIYYIRFRLNKENIIEPPDEK